METLFDVVGVALIIWGIIHVIVGILQFLIVGFGMKGAGFQSGGSFGAGFLVFLLSGGWGAFLIWAGFQIVGIQNV